METRRTARGRRAFALLVLGATVLAAGVVYLVGLFSDWSGQHRVPIETTVAALAILIIGAVISFRLVRRT